MKALSSHSLHLVLSLFFLPMIVGEPYVFKNTIKATLSSRYMIYTGLTILVFLIYHLYQYTCLLYTSRCV